MENGTELKIRDMDMGEAFTALVTECGKVFWCGEAHYKTPNREMPCLCDGTAAHPKIVRCECTAAGLLVLDAEGNGDEQDPFRNVV